MTEYTENTEEQYVEPTQQEESLGSDQEPSIPDYMSMSDEEFENLQSQSPTLEQPTEQVTSNPEIPEDTQEESAEEIVEENKPLTPDEFVGKVTSEFTANGRRVRVTDPDDVIRLMQMGMNYNKKMEAIKPNLGMLRSLKENGIESLDQLQLLLDIQKGDKAAIAKLLKDKEIDTYDLPDLEKNPYTPQSKVYTTEQAEFKDVIEDIRNIPSGSELINQLGNSQIWDNQSLEFFTAQPQSLYYLVQDKQSGLYDRVMNVIDRDIQLDKIPQEWLEKPRVELYEFIAQTLQDQDAAMNQQQAQTQQIQQPQQQIIGHNLQQGAKVQHQSNAPRAASVHATGSVAPTNPLTDVPDFLSMTDEQFLEFEKSMKGLKF